MLNSGKGAIRLFKAFGIQVYLHWSWFLIALYQIEQRRGAYDKPLWMVGEYLALFGIVLMHEFGHSLATKSVGGRAEEIILWPFGGIAFVQVPPRPGANLWAIAAGPLVNVVLVPVILVLQILAHRGIIPVTTQDAWQFLETIGYINLGLLIFNILPIYPLDGGQILRSLLWFWLGQGKSLLVAAVIGLLGGVGLVLFAFSEGSIWMGLIAFFLLSECWKGFRVAREWQQAMRAAELERGGMP